MFSRPPEFDQKRKCKGVSAERAGDLLHQRQERRETSDKPAGPTEDIGRTSCGVQIGAGA
jgi:hypothetical protein